MSSPGKQRRTCDESGATAILCAAAALMIFCSAAVAVDLGNAFVRKRDVQSQADFSALAGGAYLPAPSLTPGPGDEAVQAVAKYLYANQPQDDACAGACRTVLELQQDLTDGPRDNGELYYGSLDAASEVVLSKYKVTVITPPALVKFGLTGLMGFSSTDVSARATVGMGTPGASAEMPFYAVGGGCDYGSRLLAQPTSGHLDTVTPPSPLTKPTTNGLNDNQAMTLEQPTPVPVIALNATNATITVIGNKLASVNRVAFLRGAADSPNVFEVSSGFTKNNSAVSNIPIPAAMTTSAAVWWVRVYKPATSAGTAQEKKDGWSREYLPSGAKNMVPVQIGQDVFSCDGVNDGNFGSLKLPRTDVSNSTTNGWMPTNMAVGLQDPLSLAVLPGAGTANPQCTPGASGVAYSTTTGSPTLVSGTNCVDTDTGLTTSAATSGLVTGTSAHKGRLDRDTTTGVLTSLGRNGKCGPNKSGNRRVSGVGGVSINNDTLTCFMIDPNRTVGSIATSAYAEGPALDPALYTSPRFCYVPVLGVKPLQGSSNHYGIVGMRPAFITGEGLGSTYTAQSFLDGSSNGVVIGSSGVSALRVVFFNANALPAAGPIDDYVGTGPKAVALVD